MVINNNSIKRNRMELTIDVPAFKDKERCESIFDEFNEPVFGAQTFSAVHGIIYTGKVFKYCPWCGLKLVKKHD